MWRGSHLNIFTMFYEVLSPCPRSRLKIHHLTNSNNSGFSLHDDAVFIRLIDVRRVPSCDFQKEKTICFSIFHFYFVMR